MDLGSVSLIGSTPAVLDEQVLTGGEEGAHYAVSDDGMLVYVAVGLHRLDRRIVWVDRAGAVEPLPMPVRHYSELALSPDGQQIAVQTEDGSHGVWIYDIARASLTALSITNGSSQAPVWTPDAKHIAYRATRQGSRTLFWKATDGTGEEQRITATATGTQTPSSWSPDGTTVAFSDLSDQTGLDIWLLNPALGRTPTRFLSNRQSGMERAVFPSGRWIAYQSNESGRPRSTSNRFRALARAIRFRPTVAPSPCGPPTAGSCSIFRATR